MLLSVCDILLDSRTTNRLVRNKRLLPSRRGILPLDSSVLHLEWGNCVQWLSSGFMMSLLSRLMSHLVPGVPDLGRVRQVTRSETLGRRKE